MGRFTIKAIIPACIILSALFCLAFSDKDKEKEKGVVKIGKEENIDSEGLKIKLFKDVVTKPIPSPNFLTIHNNRGEKFDGCRPWELWTRDQYVASWGCPQGTILIFKLTLPPPSDLKTVVQGLALKKDYDAWRIAAKPDWDENSINEWLKYFTQAKLSDKSEQVQKDIPKKNKIMRYHYADRSDDLYDFVYLVECTDRPGERYFISYELSRNVDLDKSEKVIMQSLQSLAFFPPKKTGEKQSIATKIPAKKDESPEFAASRDAVIRSIKNLKGWEYLPSANFIIGYNLKNKKTISEIQSNLERSRNAFTKFYPLKGQLKAVSVCKVFDTREEYINYVPEQIKWTAGAWMPMKKELVISPANWGSSSDNRKMMVDIAYHEGFHQYLFYASDEVESTMWFNEGNACFFEGIDFKAGDRIKIDTTERLEEMKKLADTDINIERFISMDQKAYYGGNRNQNYTIGWGLMFYLLKGAPSAKEKNNYTEIPYKYYDALLELKDGDKATAKAWEGIDMKKFAVDFKEFWKSDTMIRRAEMFDPIESRVKLIPKTAAPGNTATPAGR